MPSFPFDLPESLARYLETFPEQPERTIERLTAHLKRRGLDAVGYFLLSWFHYQSGDQEKAIQEALKAKCFAPGSPFFEYVHYFMVHPQAFDAWIPKDVHRDARKYRSSSPNFLLDLEQLIQRLSKIDGHKITLSPSKVVDSGVDLSDLSTQVDDLASETLADIHIQQGNIDQARTMLKKLQTQQPAKWAYFEAKLKDLEI